MLYYIEKYREIINPLEPIRLKRYHGIRLWGKNWAESAMQSSKSPSNRGEIETSVGQGEICRDLPQDQRRDYGGWKTCQRNHFKNPQISNSGKSLTTWTTLSSGEPLREPPGTAKKAGNGRTLPHCFSQNLRKEPLTTEIIVKGKICVLGVTTPCLHKCPIFFYRYDKGEVAFICQRERVHSFIKKRQAKRSARTMGISHVESTTPFIPYLPLRHESR